MSDSLPPTAPPSNDAYGTPAAASGRWNPLAIISLIAGIVGFFFSLYGVISLVALVLGLLGRRQIAGSGQRGRGLALAGIILGIIGIVLEVILIIVGASHGAMR
ncbi:hypothetical protein GCM10025867_13620 [Frondihabitans sucicola]|uniref:DUF4190 domain-containing protein n=1 Tax=Frondihabitans sucicola TaxID=1268041 RepID=A0ABM8GL56_9MICO|nr:DUF4190 domain-containing protein [Frondihabitans sucicola]BDZ49121.1 hypothetical protein GCM10025867_13620 [Frondihabitans sucicola]